MSNPVTFISLISAAADRADMPTPSTTTFITKATWQQYVNASLAHLWEKMVEAYGSDYWVQTPFTITTDGINDAYALPTDFFKHLGTDLQLTSQPNGWITLWRFNFAQRNQYSLPSIQTIWGRTNVKYRIRGGNIWFIPLPPANVVLRLWYAPKFVPLVADTDTFDDINGWSEWVINDAAMKALVKEESDISGVQALQAVQEERLSHVIQNRDAGTPGTTVDVYRANGYGSWEFGGDGHGDWGGGEW